MRSGRPSCPICAHWRRWCSEGQRDGGGGGTAGRRDGGGAGTAGAQGRGGGGVGGGGGTARAEGAMGARCGSWIGRAGGSPARTRAVRRSRRRAMGAAPCASFVGEDARGSLAAVDEAASAPAGAEER